MNIFVVDRDPAVAAEFLCDQHVVKMALETAQILSTVARGRGLEIGYKPTHKRHPCVLWAGASDANLWWVVRHGIGLCVQYARRYGKAHACQKVILALSDAMSNPASPEPSEFVLCMPDAYKGPDPVQAYRLYYRREKLRFARWRHGVGPPSWV